MSCTWHQLYNMQDRCSTTPKYISATLPLQCRCQFPLIGQRPALASPRSTSFLRLGHFSYVSHHLDLIMRKFIGNIFEDLFNINSISILDKGTPTPTHYVTAYMWSFVRSLCSGLTVASFHHILPHLFKPCRRSTRQCMDPRTSLQRQRARPR